MAREKADPSLLEAISSADRAYQQGNAKWFDFLSSDALVYAINQTQPIKGRTGYRKAFEKSFTASKRKIKVLVRNVQMIGASGVVAQTLQITQDQVHSTVRQTVVWENQGAGWQIKHLHTALVATPVPVRTPTSAAAISVLNEKIATVSAVLGLAQ